MINNSVRIVFPEDIQRSILAVADFMTKNGINSLSDIEIYNTLNLNNMNIVLEPKFMNRTVN